ncbi:IS701 family transposase [Streptomyces bobili]|uniref:IS701 family transposase n=1 Tax=Streptomyces bobili TaxID=67280 RepID=UPI00371E9D19
MVVGVVMGGDLADVRVWASEPDVVHGRFVHRFSRSEPRESALAYMRGLIAPLQRKNGWTLAEEAGHGGPDRIQRMLNRIEWDADEVLDDVRRYVVDHLGDREAVLIVDDTGFLKKSTCSTGVQRQYSGTAGRTENSQIGVFLAYATGPGRTLIDRRLYLPTSWTDDRERCRRAGIGDEVAFETKVVMAKTMVRKAIADRIPFRWVTADAAYGFSKGRRFELEQADVFHVMATTRHDTVVTRWALDHPVHDLFPGLPRHKWKRRSWRRRSTWPSDLRLGPGRGAALAPRRPPALGHHPPQRQPARGDLLLHRLLPRRHHPGPADPHRGQPLGRRGMLPDRETGMRPGRLPGPPLPRLAPPHDPAMAAHACLTVLRARQLDTEKAETDPPSSSTSASPRSDA